MRIEGEVALVSGAASGLGAAAARRLAREGACVAVLDHDAAGAAAVADEIGATALAADVGDALSVAAVFERLRVDLGAPRLVVSCAGIGSAARIVSRDGTLSTELFERVIRVNLIGTFNVMAEAAKAMSSAPQLATGERGLILNTASIAYQDGQIGQSAYAASKGGVAAMCLPAARELARQGVRVMTIAPGLFDTPMMQGLPQETTDAITEGIPFPHRLGDPDEFAHLVTQIAANPYLNGEVIRLDAAARLPPR